MSQLAQVVGQEWLTHLFRQLYDRHPARVAMLDRYGTILAVNTSWERCDESESPCRGAESVGKNLLRRCECEAIQGDVHSSHAYVGLLDILYHRKRHYVQTYLCQGPHRHQWFKLWITSPSSELPVIILSRQPLETTL